jgi:hypothetical protein
MDVSLKPPRQRDAPHGMARRDEFHRLKIDSALMLSEARNSVR